MKPQKKRDVMKVLKKNGWRLVRNTGGHEWWEGPNGVGDALPRSPEISAGVVKKFADKLESFPNSWK